MSIDLRQLFPDKTPAEIAHIQDYLDKQREESTETPASGVTDLWEHRARKQGAVMNKSKRSRFRFFHAISQDQLRNRLTRMNEVNIKAYKSGKLAQGRQIHP